MEDHTIRKDTHTQKSFPGLIKKRDLSLKKNFSRWENLRENKLCLLLLPVIGWAAEIARRNWVEVVGSFLKASNNRKAAAVCYCLLFTKKLLLLLFWCPSLTEKRTKIVKTMGIHWPWR